MSVKNALYVVFLLTLGFACGCRRSGASGSQPKGAFSATFEGKAPNPVRRNPYVTYDFDPGAERYFVYVPQAYSGSERYGLIVFTDADDIVTRLPFGWKSILDARKYIFVAAQNAGNDQYRKRRLGLAVFGAMKVIERYRIDPSRVFAAGFSGGARMAGLLGFYQSDIFRGTLQNCGADFYRPVSMVAATSQLDTAGQPYGVFEASAEDITRAKSVRFALITGTNDFRRGNILDIYHGGFERNGFNAKLFDVPGMEHDICDGETLSRALDFLEGGP